MFESTIDFPQADLDKSVWEITAGVYKLRSSVKSTILAVLGRYPGEDLAALGDVYIVGSICSNQYKEDTDIDVHVNPDKPERFTEENSTQLRNWFEKNRDRINGWIGQHPIEVFLQLDPNQDMLSVGVYDVAADKWLKGPELASEEFNPYENYKGLFELIRRHVSNADKLFGELKRDVIDYEVIKKALVGMSPEAKKKALVSLNMKLDEIEQTIQSLYKEKGKWVDLRKNASKPTSVEQAKEDIELAKGWEDANAIFKFISRYHYFRVINDLKKMIDDDKIDQGEINKIKKVTGVADETV